VADYLLVEGLRKSFGREAAVAGVSFGVERGKILTLLGPSGCGKTTTLRCIAGLEQPEAGLITIDGEAMTSTADGIVVPPERRNVGLVFQSYAVWPHMTVAQNVAYPLEVRKWPRPQIGPRIEEVLAMVGLARFRDQYASRLSGGQQQRVALARALIFNPRLLLFDEPLSNLDAKLREQLRMEIVRLQREVGITSVYVTHDQAEAIVISDQIIVMNQGRIEQQGDAHTIYTRPANRFVAEFIGLTNLLTAKVTAPPAADGLVQATLVLDGGGHAILRAVVSGAAPPVGTRVLISIRPEDVEMGPPGPEEDNHLHGAVSSRVYMGDHIDYHVEAGGTRMRIQAKSNAPFQPGDRISLGLPPTACVSIPEDPATTATSSGIGTATSA
jgi:iron(III) transport system ATP-binding protein